VEVKGQARSPPLLRIKDPLRVGMEPDSPVVLPAPVGGGPLPPAPPPRPLRDGLGLRVAMPEEVEEAVAKEWPRCMPGAAGRGLSTLTKECPRVGITGLNIAHRTTDTDEKWK
jgi:hypothetical protein